MRMITSVVAFTAFTAVMTATAVADCQPFTGAVLKAKSQSVFGDFDQNGALSAGDKRYLASVLHDADGDPIGDLIIIANVTEVREDGSPGPRVLDNLVVLEDGMIFAASTPAAAPTHALDDTTVDPVGPGNERQRIILGGTGAYAGAKGLLTLTFNDEDVVLAFDLTCS